MRQWRVGTISLGVILLGCGGTLLAWLLSGQATPVLYLRWWPLILIVLALEILASTLQRDDETPRFRYDGASILLIAIIALGSFGLSMLNGFGLMERIASEFTGSTQYLAIDPQQIAVPDGVRQLVIVTHNSETRVVAADTPSCTVQGELRGYGNSTAWADAVKPIRPIARVVGDMLWLELPDAQGIRLSGQQVHQSQYEVIVPQNMLVEIDCRDYARLELRPRQVHQDWMIKGDQAAVTITAASTDTLRVQASERDPSQLSGNVTWLDGDKMSTALVGSGKATISVFSHGPVAVYRQ